LPLPHDTTSATIAKFSERGRCIRSALIARAASIDGAASHAARACMSDSGHWLYPPSLSPGTLQPVGPSVTPPSAELQHAHPLLNGTQLSGGVHHCHAPSGFMPASNGPTSTLHIELPGGSAGDAPSPASTLPHEVVVQRLLTQHASVDTSGQKQDDIDETSGVMDTSCKYLATDIWFIASPPQTHPD